MSVEQKFWKWAERNNVTGKRYEVLFARAVNSPAGKRGWRGW